ncbi:MAG: hypothetical protein AAF772_19590, partial [Acidobacteriota bacterium]
MRLPPLCALVVLIISAASTLAAQVPPEGTVTVRLLRVDGLPQLDAFGIEARQADGDAVARAITDAQGVATLRLPETTPDDNADGWHVRVVDDALWSAPTPLSGDAQTLTLRAWPAATIVAALHRADGQRLADDLPIRVRFLPPDARDRAARKPRAALKHEQPAGEVDCRRAARANDGAAPTDDVPIRCVVPAGTHNLRLRATGHVSHFAHEITLAHRGVHDWGRVALEPGASVVGFVVTESTDEAASSLAEGETSETAGAPDNAPAVATITTVELEPQPGPQAASQGVEAGSDPRTLNVTADARGFFHLTGVAPGVYRLRAARDGWLDADVER